MIFGSLLIAVCLGFSFKYLAEWRLAAVPLGLIFLGFAALLGRMVFDLWREA